MMIFGGCLPPLIDFATGTPFPCGHSQAMAVNASTVVTSVQRTRGPTRRSHQTATAAATSHGRTVKSAPLMEARTGAGQSSGRRKYQWPYS